jgi:AbrB family looped-hinge helix DNA binding protein
MAEASVRMSSNGRVTIPKEIRDALGLEPGGEVVFRLEGGRAALARTAALLGPDRSVTTTPGAGDGGVRGARVQTVATVVRPGR